MNKKKFLFIALIGIIGFEIYLFFNNPRVIVYLEKYRERKTVAGIINLYGENVKKRLAPNFEKSGVKYPPDKITIVALKNEKILEVWSEVNEIGTLIKKYAILAASGKPGPKLAEGDFQVPEGIYRIEALNPNSGYHLSLKVNYPNAYDRQKAIIDNRTKLGKDIFIHGGAASVGCLAIGDEAIEELFILAAGAVKNDIKVIIAPYDMRNKNAAAASSGNTPSNASNSSPPSWVPELYKTINDEISKYH